MPTTLVTVKGELDLPTDVKKRKKAQRVHDGRKATAQLADERQPASQGATQDEEHQPSVVTPEEEKGLILTAANEVSFSNGDEAFASGEDEAPISPGRRHTSNRKRKRRKAAGLSTKDLANKTIAQTEKNEDEFESKETEHAFLDKGESEMSRSSSSSSDHEESSLEESDSEDGDGEKRADDSTAFGRAFQKIMKKKLPSSVLGETMGPILSAHKQLMVKKLEEAAEGRKARSESKKEKQALREKGHVVPASYTTAKDKELIKLATRGVVKLFNAVSKAQSVQEAGKASRTTETKEVAKRSKSTFLAMLQGGNGSGLKVQKQIPADKKERMAEPQPAWSALQDTFMLGKSRLKDWDKKQDEGNDVEGIRDSGDDSDSE